MPPILLPPQLLLYYALFFAAAALVSSRHVCAPAHERARACPPFGAPPTAFPFSSARGCGHPAFQIRCSSPFSLISINSSSFYLRRLLPHQRTVLLSPANTTSSSSSYSGAPSCPPLPTGPIDISGSPFRFSSDHCSYLYSLHQCSNSSTDVSACNSNLSSWQRGLLAHPLLLLTSCARRPRAASRGQCHPNVAESISRLLADGLRVEWESKDDYFTRCASCQNSTGGTCGFNDSDASKPFLCFHSTEDVQRRQPAAATNTRRLLVLTTTLFALASLVLLLLSLWAASSLRRRRDAAGIGSSARMSAFLRRYQLRPPVFTYEQLRAATGGFDPLRKIGDGGFGSVYLAQLEDGRAAAVKRLHRRQLPAATASFCNEVIILSSLAHPSLVRLHGYCCDPCVGAGGVYGAGEEREQPGGLQPPRGAAPGGDGAVQVGARRPDPQRRTKS